MNASRPCWLVICLLFAAIGFVPPGTAQEKGGPPKPPDVKLSGPFTHDNLTIFLIHGDDLLKGKSFLTLGEALEQKKVVVHETQEVSQLSIENVSDKEEVFVQAGDIVKGGQQDRVLITDLIVPPKTKVPISSFCVEAGRWSKRGEEDSAKFDSAKEQLATRDLKLAARKYASQQEVWKNVSKAQMDLSKNVGAEVKGEKSASSLQLTLEHKKLIEAVEAYMKKLEPIVNEPKDVIGYAIAVNGKLSSADIYASSGLFKKLWPKLVKASAVEAMAELQKDKKFEPATAEAVKAFLADAEKGKASEKEVDKRLKLITQESEKNLLFETRDRELKDVILRRSYLAK